MNKSKKKRTKSEQISLLNKERKKVARTLGKVKKESQRLETRILRRESEGLSAKYLEKILATKRKASRSIRNKLKSIDRRLKVLTESPGIYGLFIIEKFCKKNIIATALKH